MQEGLDDKSPAHTSIHAVTVDITGQDTWVLPISDVLHYDYGRRGHLIVSSQHGLFEANAVKHTVQELKPPTTGQAAACCIFT